MSSRPKVFVSSTVYDFRDLRSSLKHWLEEYGCHVQMSEHSDFVRDLDENSYDACLSAIDSCDYFVLLVGARVGGWYDEDARISITRQEYRHAYERHRVGKMRIIPFIRREIWDIREDRRALAQYLKRDFLTMRELTPQEVYGITHHSSKFVNDSEFVFDFIAELARSTEMTQAAATGGARPGANWLHPFSTFDEIVAALRPALGLTTNLRRRGMVANLLNEIVENLKLFLEFDNEELVPVTRIWERARSQLLGQVTPDRQGSSSVDGVTLGFVCVYALSSTRTAIDTTFLEDALRSGEFLTYDAATDSLQVGEEQRALLKLLHSLKQFQRISTKHTRGAELFAAYGSGAKGPVSVKNLDLAALAFYHDAQLVAFRELVAAHLLLRYQKIPSVQALRPTLREAFVGGDFPDPNNGDIEKWLAGQTRGQCGA